MQHACDQIGDPEDQHSVKARALLRSGRKIARTSPPVTGGRLIVAIVRYVSVRR